MERHGAAAGLFIDPASGLISGMPRPRVCSFSLCPQPPAVYTPTVTVTDADGTEASLSLTLTLTGSRVRLLVAAAGPGSGVVTSVPAGIDGDCAMEGACEASFEDTTTVTLAEKPDPGSAFEGWFGDGCSGTGGCSVVLGREAIEFVVARFVRAPARPEPEPPGEAAPGTRITKAKISPTGTATFRFRALGAGRSFSCALVPAARLPAFAPCSSPRTYRHLNPGRYTFSVRASGSGGTDATPARHAFRVPR